MSQGITYSVDLVFCIDATGSMGGLIDKVKINAIKLESDLSDGLAEAGKVINNLRVRVISFRDYFVDGNNAMDASEFFSLPDQSTQLSEYIGSITAMGGGDEPESGLEALAIAMKSDWVGSAEKKRHVIVVWTDASTHELEKDGLKEMPLEESMPTNFDELTDMWEGQDGMDMSAKRLILFAPDAYAWTDMANHWSQTIQHTSKAAEGLSDVDYDSILSTIVNSI
jgi:hypothetical protein